MSASGSDEFTATFNTQTAMSAGGAGGTVLVRRLVTVHAPSGLAHASALVTDAPIEIGRAPHAQGPLSFDDREMSKLHAVVQTSSDGGVWIEDRGSRNGTYVNGSRVQRAPLASGSVVRVGRSVLVYLEEDVPSEVSLARDPGRLVGSSVPMKRLRAEIALVAPRNVPVLILGETGVGKELVAAELHAQSGRKGDFVPVNCASLPDNLAESELFGHTRTAFTGAQAARDGLFVAARGGTLLLDEIGEMPLPLQAKLLRALATGEVRPVGSDSSVRVDVRVIAATHRDLERRVEEGTFRADLLARIAGWTLRAPALRDRKDDVVPLARVFLERLAPGAELGPDAAEALTLGDWPFNVRGLERALEYASVKARGGAVRAEHLPPEIGRLLGNRSRGPEGSSAAAPAAVPLEVLVPREATPDREGLLRVVRHYGGNMEQVARYFGKDRRQIYRWFERLGIDPDAARGG